MFCFQPCLSESLYQKIHSGRFANTLSTRYHQFIGIKERSLILFVLDEENSNMNCFKICEKDLFIKIKSSEIIKSHNSNGSSNQSDLIILSLENETLIILQFVEQKEEFQVITHYDLSSFNVNKLPIEKIGDRIKIVNDLILVCSYYNNIQIFKYESFHSSLIHRSSIQTNYFISDLDYSPETLTLYLLCHTQAENGQIDMHIQFYIKDKDNFKYETSFEKTDLIPENISYRILSNIANKCLTISPVDGLIEWNVASFKKESSHNIELETVVDIFSINNLLLLFLDDNTCLCFEDREKLSNPTKVKIGTNQKAVNWSVYSANGFIYAFLNGHTGVEFYKFYVVDNDLERIECILKQNSYSNVIDSQIFTLSPVKNTIVSLSLKPESVDYNIWDSLSETYYGGQLINVLSQSLKIPLISLKSWILETANSKIILLQTLHEVYFLTLKNLFQEDFSIKLESFTQSICQGIKNLIHAVNINDLYSILITSTQIFLMNLQTFEVKDLDFSGKVDLASTFLTQDDCYILINTRDLVYCYSISKSVPKTLSLFKTISVSFQISFMFCFELGNYYLVTFDYEGLMTFYNIETQQVLQISTNYIIGSAAIQNNRIVLGDRSGNVLIYSINLQNDQNLKVSFEMHHNIGEKKVSIKPVNNQKGFFIYSEQIFFFKAEEILSEPYPVKYSSSLNVEEIHILNEDEPHLLTIEKGEIKFFLAELDKNYRKNDFPLDNSFENFKILKNDPDQIRRLLIDESTSTINLLTRNLHIITCDKTGRIILVRTLPNKKNTNNSFLINAKVSTMTIQEKIKSFFIVSFKNANNYYLNFYTIEQASDFNSDLSNSPIKVRKLGVSDILSTDIITDAVIIDNEKIMVVSIGATLALYGLEEKEKDEELCISFKERESKIFRFNFAQLQALGNLIIASDQNSGVSIFKIEKHSLGENLGHKWEFVTLCVISNKMPCDSLFWSQDEYIVLNKLGELSVRNSKHTDYFNHCLEYCTGYIGDMCRRMLVNLTHKDGSPSEIYVPGLKGGLIKVMKISEDCEKNTLQTLKFVENCYKEILLYGEPIDVENKLALNDGYMMLDWKVLNNLKKESEHMRSRILNTCFSLLPEKALLFSNVYKLLDKF